MPDPASGRLYDVEISLPSDYDRDASTHYPVIYLADGGRETRPVTCQIRELYKNGTLAQEPIIVGLSYAKGESLVASRKRDYTPAPRKPGDTAYGGAQAYQHYLRQTVIPMSRASIVPIPTGASMWDIRMGGFLARISC